MPRLFAIGDIHGDISGLAEVIAQMAMDGLNFHEDTLVQVGDMVDGYDHSYHVVASMRALQVAYPDNVIVLKGNHEDMMLRAMGKSVDQSDFRNWWYQGGKETYFSYVDESNEAPDYDFLLPMSGVKCHPVGFMKQDLEWFRSLPLWYETDNYYFVHAGFRPPLPPEANKPRDMMWIREEFFDSPYEWDKQVVYGHSAREQIHVARGKIGIDTRWRGKGCVSGVELDANGIVKIYEGDRDG